MYVYLFSCIEDTAKYFYSKRMPILDILKQCNGIVNTDCECNKIEHCSVLDVIWIKFA